MVKTVLVVDDEPDVVKVLKQRLENLGFKIQTASSGPEALKMVQKNPPNLVLLDIMMPGMTGAEVAEHIKQDPAISDIPVIFLYAILGKSEEKMGGNMIGGNLIFAKPYDFDALVKKINELI